VAEAQVTRKATRLGTEAPQRALPTGRTSQLSRWRVLSASGALSGIVALVYFKFLGPLHPAGGKRLVLWPLVALGMWASISYPVRVRNRKMSLSIGLSEIPVLVEIVFQPSCRSRGRVLRTVCSQYPASAQPRENPVQLFGLFGRPGSSSTTDGSSEPRPLVCTAGS
jgi:hypothetical protein